MRALHASGYLKILYAILALIYIISLPGDCHAYARNDKRAGTPTPERTLIQGVLINVMCLFGVRAATAASLGAPSFRRTQAPFASTTTSCSCSPWFFVLLFPHDKNFAFIFDMQALVRLFLPSGSPCVRSTSDCAVLLRSWRTKDGGITSELSLSMRVPIVSPANDG